MVEALPVPGLLRLVPSGMPGMRNVTSPALYLSRSVVLFHVVRSGPSMVYMRFDWNAELLLLPEFEGGCRLPALCASAVFSADCSFSAIAYSSLASLDDRKERRLPQLSL